MWWKVEARLSTRPLAVGCSLGLKPTGCSRVLTLLPVEIPLLLRLHMPLCSPVWSRPNDSTLICSHMSLLRLWICVFVSLRAHYICQQHAWCTPLGLGSSKRKGSWFFSESGTSEGGDYACSFMSLFGGESTSPRCQKTGLSFASPPVKTSTRVFQLAELKML